MWVTRSPALASGAEGQVIWVSRNPVKPKIKIFRFTGILICGIDRPARVTMRDVRAIVTERGAGCDGRCGVRRVRSPDEIAGSVRQSRVVLAPRPWRLFCGRYPADNGDNKRRSPGRARRKP